MKRHLSWLITGLSFFVVVEFSFIPIPLSGQVIKSTEGNVISTFSIVAYDSSTGEFGVAVASRFFSVGSVVPWAKAGVGAVATQSFANTSFGWRGLAYLEQGKSSEEALQALLKNDDNPSQRQVGIVSTTGHGVSYTGENCIAWAGGRSGSGYAIQGNILAGEGVVIAMEENFLNSSGTLARKIYTALVAGNEAGGDSRGKQSAAILLVKDGAGYGGYTDRAIDIRVDDNVEPFKELGRLLDIGEMNYAWNEGWTAFMQDRPKAALPSMERAIKLAPDMPELWYDHAVINLAAGSPEKAIHALDTCLKLNPKLKIQAQKDSDLDGLRGNSEFEKLVK
ncbi:MAG: DUF1028 domain-containing protein [Candidatus Neomarinimicrobiota bacterium]